MALLISNSPGQVTAIQVPGDVGLPIGVGGLSGSWFPALRAISTDISIGLDGNAQFMHTLANAVYVYAFGDRISQIQLGGIAFAHACPGPDGQSGAEAVLAFYNANRVAAQSTPTVLQIGTSLSGRFIGYLTSLKLGVSNPEMRLSQFGLTYSVLPSGV